jgi:surface protein
MDELLQRFGYDDGIDDDSIHDLVNAYIFGDKDISTELRQFPIGTWDVSQVTNMSTLFNGRNSFNESLESWVVSNVTNMKYMFADCPNFNQPLDSWDIRNVEDMADMFANCTNFNQPLDSWDIRNVEDMAGMFANCTSFNQPLDSWVVSNVTNMKYMFSECTSFNQPLDSWDVSIVDDMTGMFYGCTNFNQPLDSWDVSGVADTTDMFSGCTSFNQPLDSWVVSNVEIMSEMFKNCTNFNQPLDSWDFSYITDMTEMFSGCTNFNQPLDSWDVSGVTNMTSMFSGCTSFNQPLDSWDVSSVTDMDSMFSGCTSFNQPLDSWDVSNVTNMEHMFDGTDVNFRSTIIQHFFDIDIAKDPNNSSKHLFVNIGVHGACFVKTSCDKYVDETFTLPNFTNFKLIRGAPIGTLSYSYHNKGFYTNKSVTVLENGKYVKHYIPTYHDKYDSYKPTYDVNNPIIEYRATLDKPPRPNSQTYNHRKYGYEQSKLGMFDREINSKTLINKTLNMSDEGLNQIVFIVDRADPILLRIREPNNTIYSKYYREHYKKKKFTFEELLLFIYSLGFRNVEVRDNSCSGLYDAQKCLLDPYDPETQKRIEFHKDHGGTRKRKHRRSKRHTNCSKRHSKRRSRRRCKRKSRKHK